jgi:hypothetical protein
MSVSGDVPNVQITIESPSSQGFGDTLVLYFLQRISENDAATPNGSSLRYFANVTVIGKPMKK